MIDPQNQWGHAALMVLLSVWAGVVSYLRTLVKGAEFKMLACVYHLSPSALAGFVTVMICHEYSFSIQWTGVACAISGHMGAEAVKIFEDKWRRKSEGMLQ